MITDAEKWHYLAVKSSPALLRGIKIFTAWVVYICFVQMISLKTMKKYVIIIIIVM